jgi:hypothetical protein
MRSIAHKLAAFGWACAAAPTSPSAIANDGERNPFRGSMVAYVAVSPKPRTLFNST